MAESQSPLALAGEDDDTDQTMAGSDDYAPGTFSGSGGLGALDVPGAAQALALMSKSSQQARAALQSAREKIAARKYDRSLPWFALSSALSKPTRTGAIGEVFGNVSDALAPTVRERAAFKANQEKELLGLDTQIAGLDQNAAQAQLSLAALQARLAAQGANASNDRVIGPDGTVRYASHASARGQPAWTPASAQTNVTLNADKTLATTMSEGAGKRYDAQFEAALQAPKQMERSQRILGLLDKGVYTGAGADFKLQFGKLAKTAGFDYAGSDIANTEQLASELANSTLGMIRASGLGGGTGFSNTDRDFVEKAAGGKINWDKNTLRMLANLNLQAQRNVMQTWNDSYGRLVKFPKNKEWLDQAGYIPFEIPGEKRQAPASPPPEAAAPAAAPRSSSNGPQYGLAPAQWAVDPGNPPPRASPQMEQFLKDNPDTAQEFIDHYHYLPQ